MADNQQMTKQDWLKVLGVVIAITVICNIAKVLTGSTEPEAASETKEQCIDRVAKELTEREKGKVLTRENIQTYYDEYKRRCNLN